MGQRYFWENIVTLLAKEIYMKYLNSTDIETLHSSWVDTIQVIKNTVALLQQNLYDQPIKPYLSFENSANRIIAMPARIGHDKTGTCGIKWIASFPDNINHDISRANSVTILNSSTTGQIKCIINTSTISAIRTASVTGYFLSEYFKKKNSHNYSVLLLGFGPIGQHHLDMLLSEYSSLISNIYIYYLRDVSVPQSQNVNIEKISNWKEQFSNVDIALTCTTSSNGYINLPPKQGSLHLNVSLRDYHYNMQKYFTNIFVDNWDEVCRANTDIEVMHNKNNLSKESVIEISSLEDTSITKDDISFFCPMGMACFDIAIAEYFYNRSNNMSLGISLD